MTCDAAGNMMSDGFHLYTRDAEGNVTQVDGGSTATYTYDSLNQRIRADRGTMGYEFVLNLNGQRTAYYDVSGGSSWLGQGQVYWGSVPSGVLPECNRTVPASGLAGDGAHENQI